MGQKSNPIGLRLGGQRTWDALWYQDQAASSFLHQDLAARALLTRVYQRDGALTGRILSTRSPTKAHWQVPVYAPSEVGPPLLKEGVLEEALAKIQGQPVEVQIQDLRTLAPTRRAAILSLAASTLSAFRSRPYFDSTLELLTLSLLSRSPLLFAKGCSRQIEKDYRHGTFLDFLKRLGPWALDQFPEIQGLRIQCKGRLNGADRSKVHWFQYGQVPLQTFSQEIDYGYAPAFTPYGVCGIKVWWVYAPSQDA